VIPFASVPIAVANVATVARIVVFALRSGLMTQLYPWHLDVADVIITVAWIEIEHGFPRRWRTRSRLIETTTAIMRSLDIGGNSRLDGVGPSWVERVLVKRPSRKVVATRSHATNQDVAVTPDVTYGRAH
jgi:hypothetical protein